MFEKSICTHERCPLIYENANWEMRRRRHIDDFTRQGGVSAGGIRNERYSIRSNTVDYGASTLGNRPWSISCAGKNGRKP